MLTTKQPVFRRFWHATVPLSTLADGPKPFTLLGEAIVLFLGPDGAPAALRDRCCHRTAKLSRGWCEDGRLVCGDRGWIHDTAGRVVRIPQHEPDRPIPPDDRTRAYRCTARCGYAWVALEDPIAPIPDVPEFDDPGLRTISQFRERWETSPLRALENSFDNAHFSGSRARTRRSSSRPTRTRGWTHAGAASSSRWTATGRAC